MTALLNPQAQPATNGLQCYPILAYEIAVRAALACVSTAQDAITTIDQYAWSSDEREIGLLNHWWVNVLYLYNAGTLLIAGRLCRVYTDTKYEGSVAASLALAKQALQRYERHGRRVQTVVDLLTALEAKAYNMLNDSHTTHQGTANDAMEVVSDEARGVVENNVFSNWDLNVPTFGEQGGSAPHHGLTDYFWPFNRAGGDASLDWETFGL